MEMFKLKSQRKLYGVLKEVLNVIHELLFEPSKCEEQVSRIQIYFD